MFTTRYGQSYRRTGSDASVRWLVSHAGPSRDVSPRNPNPRLAAHRGITRGEPRIDTFSSGRWFTGWIGICQHDDGNRPTPKPSVYLLTTGWKHHGLIHAGERPAAR